MPRIQAIVDMPFGNGKKRKGERFDATEQEANLLVALKRARRVVEEAPAQVETRHTVAETPVQPAKRTYRRRDLKAES